MNVNLTPNITGKNVNIIKGATQADLTNSVNNSKIYRDEAEAFSIVSEAKSVEASYSALNASISATTAIDKATIATNKANEANNSAINSSASETVCIAKATIATDNADIAIAQAVIATNKATEANTSANTANTQANIAITKASEASTSASNALVSANNADTSEANALTYRNQAESFANSINPSDLVHISGTETITGNKTFSGTVSGLTKATVGLGNVTNESKATMFTNSTLTGTVTLPSTTSIGTISSTELGYIDGVTSNIQTQLDSKNPNLVSGTNIKTINSSTILGSGNINLVDLTTDQTIAGVKTFSNQIRATSTQNNHAGAGLSTYGNGAANTIFPSIGFHQPGTFAGTIALTSNGVYSFLGGNDGVSKASVEADLIGNATSVTDGVYTTGNQTIGGVKTFSSSPIAPTPTTDTQVANKAYVDTNAGISLATANSYDLGVNQTWENMTASRSAGVTYTNNTGKPIALSITGSEANGFYYIKVNGVNVVDNFEISGTDTPMFCIVPHGATYSVTISYGTVRLWQELR